MKKLTLFCLLTHSLFSQSTDLSTELTSGVTLSDSVSQGEMIYYNISATANQKIDSLLNKLHDDADLYVKVGSKPTKESYDCRSNRTKIKNEDCSVTVDSDRNIYIGVYGYKATSYQIKASLTSTNNTTTLNSGVPLSNSVNEGETKYYKIAVQNGQAITAFLDQLNEDVDLYLKIGAKPTTDIYDCSSTRSHVKTETCSLTLDQDNDVYIGVHGYRTSSYRLKATLAVANNPLTVITSGELISDSILQDETKFYKISGQNGQVINAVLDQLQADADLYLRVGLKPTGTEYDCKSSNGGTLKDTCSQILNSNSDIYLAVYAYEATSYNLKVTLDGDIDNSTLLTSGENHSSSVLLDKTDHYKIHVNAGETLSVLLDQLNQDADLFVQIDSKPTGTYYACKSTNGGTANEKCEFSLRTEADVFIAVYGFKATDYRLKATVTATPVGSNIIEDGENGLSSHWETLKGPFQPILYNRPNVPSAPAGSKVIVFPLDSAVGQQEYFTSYAITVNDSIHKILEVDLGGTPDYTIPYHTKQNLDYPGYLIHYAIGVEVETMKGTRRMSWDSFYTHNGADAHKGVGNWLEYPSPTEMVRGYFNVPTNLWNHFKVDLEQQLQLIEPDNRLVKVNYFFTLGGSLDNIKLSSD